MTAYELLEQGQPLKEAKKALIFLHGRGGSARDILNLANLLSDQNFHIAIPQAPNHSWYPHSFMADDKLNEPCLAQSVKYIRQLIEGMAPHIPQNQIFLAGFSQGACLALEVSARFAAPYGGIIAFSGGLIGNELDETKYKGNFEGTKVFIGNSDQDPHIPLIRSQQSGELLKKLGADVTHKIYKGMGHVINQDEISWVKKNILKT